VAAAPETEANLSRAERPAAREPSERQLCEEIGEALGRLQERGLLEGLLAPMETP
jgi:hypothetical protein